LRALDGTRVGGVASKYSPPLPKRCQSSATASRAVGGEPATAGCLGFAAPRSGGKPSNMSLTRQGLPCDVEYGVMGAVGGRLAKVRPGSGERRSPYWVGVTTLAITGVGTGVALGQGVDTPSPTPSPPDSNAPSPPPMAAQRPRGYAALIGHWHRGITGLDLERCCRLIEAVCLGAEVVAIGPSALRD